MSKIKFSSGSASPFFNSLDKDIRRILSSTRIILYARRTLWFKMAFFFVLHIASWLWLYLLPHPEVESLILNYIFIGISGILLAFNVSHDACHETFSKTRAVNYWLYHLTFNLQGPNAYLWKLRHRSSHHLFPNVDGCDADIDDNPIIRLSPQHPIRKHQRYQHLYAFFVYCFYTLHWFLFKDVLYLFKKRVANLVNRKHPLREWILFFFWKFLYLFLIIGLPVITGYPFPVILFCFFIMNVLNSQFFIHTLIATHFCMETGFPITDENGSIPGDYYSHQLATSLDYLPESKFCNWFLGGFNAHAAHHLYPKLPHTLYPVISVFIEKKAKEFKMPYHKLGFFDALRSHYRYLKVMGNGSREA